MKRILSNVPSFDRISTDLDPKPNPPGMKYLLIIHIKNHSATTPALYQMKIGETRFFCVYF